MFGEGPLVGDHNDGHAGISLNFAKQHEDGFAGSAVEIAGGLVGEQDFRAIHQSAGDGGALLLATRKLARTMADALFKSDALEGFADSRGALGTVDLRETQRELDVFFERHPRKKIEGLKNHPDGLPAVASQFERGHLREILALGDDRSGAGTVEAGDEIKQRGFSGTGAAQQGEEFAGWNRERDIVDGADDGFAHEVVAGNRFKTDGGRKLGHKM